MAFIEKRDPTVLNIMLTSCGRELLSTGNLTFKYYAIGDSEVDYRFNANASTCGFDAFDSNILRPADKYPKQLSFIPRNYSGDPYNEILTIPSASYEIQNPVPPIGFFTSGATEFITDSDHVKQPDAMVAMSGVSGGRNIKLLKAPTYGSSGNEPARGDLLLVKWTAGDDTTGYTVGVNAVGVDYPTPYLIYQIVSISGGTSLGANNLVVTVDRDIPDLSALSLISYAGAMVYYNQLTFTGATILTDYGTDYLDAAVLSFLQNSQCPTVVFPFWNMSIIFTEEIAGVSGATANPVGSDRAYTQFNSRGYGGFVSYIQNQAPIYKKLGVIHYTNSSPANVYGEGFYQDTPVLEIPTVMWHKSLTPKLGVTLTPIGGIQTLTGETVSLDARYYDLADPLGFVVGKVFIDLKLFVIEDQELLFAMSYKSNRSWSLPDYTASTIIPVPCPLPPTGISVTWLQPVVNCIDFSVARTWYCHSTSGDWIEFTGSKSLIGVDQTGYRVETCREYPLNNSCTCICALVVGGGLITSTSCEVNAPLYCTTSHSLTQTSSYYYKSTIDED